MTGGGGPYVLPVVDASMIVGTAVGHVCHAPPV